ncbi:unnamed protein product [Amoebophrya sp. A120]|nr:unnamed protein product [Amoebophrya sp. A120]|eukprot:GSA120T00008654001.1
MQSLATALAREAGEALAESATPSAEHLDSVKKFLTHITVKDDLIAGDHIYTYRLAYTYSHHGIVVWPTEGMRKVGERTSRPPGSGRSEQCRVVAVSSHEEDGKTSPGHPSGEHEAAGALSELDKQEVLVAHFSGWVSPRRILVSTLEEFLKDSQHAHRVKYNASYGESAIKRAGVAHNEKADPAFVTILRALSLVELPIAEVDEDENSNFPHADAADPLSVSTAHQQDPVISVPSTTSYYSKKPQIEYDLLVRNCELMAHWCKVGSEKCGCDFRTSRSYSVQTDPKRMLKLALLAGGTATAAAAVGSVVATGAAVGGGASSSAAGAIAAAAGSEAVTGGVAASVVSQVARAAGTGVVMNFGKRAIQAVKERYTSLSPARSRRSSASSSGDPGTRRGSGVDLETSDTGRGGNGRRNFTVEREEHEQSQPGVEQVEEPAVPAPTASPTLRMQGRQIVPSPAAPAGAAKVESSSIPGAEGSSGLPSRRASSASSLTVVSAATTTQRQTDEQVLSHDFFLKLRHEKSEFVMRKTYLQMIDAALRECDLQIPQVLWGLLLPPGDENTRRSAGRGEQGGVGSSSHAAPEARVSLAEAHAQPGSANTRTIHPAVFCEMLVQAIEAENNEIEDNSPPSAQGDLNSSRSALVEEIVGMDARVWNMQKLLQVMIQVNAT